MTRRGQQPGAIADDNATAAVPRGTSREKPGDPRLPLTRARWIVRGCGTLVLAACIGLLVYGVTAGTDRLQGEVFVRYWSVCFLLALGAALTAVIDLLLLRRAYRRSRRALFARQFMSADLVEQAQARREETATK